MTETMTLPAVEEKLHKFLFPVEERKVFFQDKDGNPNYTREYKSIVRADNNKLISIMNNTYTLVPNSQVILPLVKELNNLDTKWDFDRSHSFVKDNRMKLQVKFPDLTFDDGNGSDIALSLFIHNSYDGSEGVRMLWGAIRGICTNGMVFGKVLSKFYARHTKNIQVANLKNQLAETYDQIPVIKERIDILKRLDTAELVEKSVKKEFGVRAYEYVKSQPHPANQWALYNYLTYYISHIVQQHMRTSYQLKVSKMFGV